MTVPLDKSNNYSSHIKFSRWLPGEKEAITYTKDGFTVRYWTDFDCLDDLAREITEERLSKIVGVKVEKIQTLVDFVLENEKLEKLAEHYAAMTDYSYKKEIERRFGEDTLEEYYSIGRTTYTAVMRGLNRIIGYIRSTKGQYWLEDYPILDKNYDSELRKSETQIRFNDGKWIELRSEWVIEYTVTVPNEQRCVAEEDWCAIQEFVQSQRREPIVGHLLSIAEKLSREGYRRAALIEAVSAMEVALHEFGSQAIESKPTQCKDINTGFLNLKRHLEHLGMTCSINYLLPLILEESEASHEIFGQCQKAIEERNNVVHNSQRDVQSERLSCYLRNIRSLCQMLGVI